MNRHPLRLRLLSGLLPLLAISPAHAQDLVGFSDQDTCQSVIDAEIAHGAKRIPHKVDNPVMKDFFGTVQFQRTHNGTPATITYLCDGTKTSGGRISTQLIHIERHSELAARAEYERQKLALEASLGAPCWDPARLSDTQRDRLKELGKTEDTLLPITRWKSAPGLVTGVGWSLAGENPRASRWYVTIDTHGRSIIATTNPQSSALARMIACQDDDPISGAAAPK